MKLSDIPRDKIPIGLEVWNAKKTQTGTIKEILPEDREDISILIEWKDGNESYPWHFWCDKIEIVVPHCCYVCSFEKPEGCSLLGISLNQIFAKDAHGGCPPVNICPLILNKGP